MLEDFNMKNLGLASKENHQVQRRKLIRKSKEAMLTLFPIIQKKRNPLIKNKSSPLSIQGMEEGQLQGRILPQVKVILTVTKQSFLVIVFIIKTLVIKPSIARLIKIMLQEIRINKASDLASKNKKKLRLTTILILWLSMIQVAHYVIIMVMMNKIVHSKRKIYKRMNPLSINVA